MGSLAAAMSCHNRCCHQVAGLIRYIFCFLLLCLSSVQATADDVLPLPAQAAQVSYNAHIVYWVDTSNQATLREAQAASYTPLKQQVLPASKHPHWFKLAVQSQATEALTWIFSSHWTPIDFLDVWVVSGDKTQFYALGDHRPYQDRTIKSRRPAFPVTLAPQQHATIYIRAQGMSLNTIIGELSSLSAFEAQNKTDDVTFGIFFGVLGMMALIALLVGLWVKDLAMIGYSGYVLSFMFTSFALLGYVSVFFSDWAVGISDIFIGVFSLLLLISISWMWIPLLQLKTHYKKLYWGFLVISMACVLALPLVFSSYYAELNVVMRWMSYPFNIIPPILLISLWQRYKKPEHLIYLLSFAGLLLSSFVYISMTQNLFPLTLNKANFYLSMLLLNIVIMSIGMAFRVRQIQLDKLAADSKADLALQRTQEERRFVAMLSHEFRNPLASIDRSAQMLILTNPDIAKATTNRFHSIRASVSRLSSLVDNFLMSERLEQGQFSLHLSTCSSGDLVADISSHFTEEDWQRIEVTEDEANFDVDLNLVSMAVSNLIHNALRYAYPDTKTQLTLSLENQSVNILVSDSGPCISEDEIQMFGTPYYLANNSFGKKGTGLGYYFCRRIVELHGGTLTASKNQLNGLDVLIELKKSHNVTSSNVG